VWSQWLLYYNTPYKYEQGKGRSIATKSIFSDVIALVGEEHNQPNQNAHSDGNEDSRDDQRGADAVPSLESNKKQ
jgi:hypothetical protein